MTGFHLGIMPDLNEHNNVKQSSNCFIAHIKTV